MYSFTLWYRGTTDTFHDCHSRRSSVADTRGSWRAAARVAASPTVRFAMKSLATAESAGTATCAGGRGYRSGRVEGAQYVLKATGGAGAALPCTPRRPGRLTTASRAAATPVRTSSVMFSTGPCGAAAGQRSAGTAGLVAWRGRKLGCLGGRRLSCRCVAAPLTHPHKLVQQVRGHPRDVHHHELVLQREHPRVVVEGVEDLEGGQEVREGGRVGGRGGWAAGAGGPRLASAARGWLGRWWAAGPAALRPWLSALPRRARPPGRTSWRLGGATLRAARLSAIVSTYMHESVETVYTPFSRPAAVGGGGGEGA